MKVFLIAAFFALSANASSNVMVPSFKAKLANRTSISDDQLKLKVQIVCEYTEGLIYPQHHSCGSQELELSLASDGTFVVPDLNYQSPRPMANHQVTFLVDTTKPDAGTYGYVVSTKYIGDDIPNVKNMAVVSLYEIPKLKVNVVTPTGQDYAAWRGYMINANNGEVTSEPCVNISYSWKLNGYHSPDNHSDLIYDAETFSNDTDVAKVLKPTYLLVQSDAGADPVVSADVSYTSYKKLNCTTHVFSSDYTTFVAKFKEPLSSVVKKISGSTVKVD